MHVYTARLAVMDLALNDGRIGTGFHLEPGDAIVVNVIQVEVALKKKMAKKFRQATFHTPADIDFRSTVSDSPSRYRM